MNCIQNVEKSLQSGINIQIQTTPDIIEKIVVFTRKHEWSKYFVLLFAIMI